MKKVVFALITGMFVSTSALAETVEVLINGKPGGTFFARSTMYAEGLEKLGWTVSTKDLKKGSRGLEYFLETDQPTLMVYGAEHGPLRGTYHDVDNFVSAEYTSGMYLCVNKGALDKNKIKLGFVKVYNTEFFVNWLESQGKTVTQLPYENSGYTLQGILGGDVDAMMINQSKATKFMKDGNACVMQTGEKETLGVPSYREFNTTGSVPVQLTTVMGKNIDLEQLRVAVKQVQQSEEFQNWLTKNNLSYVDDALSREQELALVNQTEKLWEK